MHTPTSIGLKPPAAPVVVGLGILPAAAANAPLHTSVCSRWLGSLASTWGLGGTMLFLLASIVHLTAISTDALAEGLSLLDWPVLVCSVLVIAHIVGYRALQKLWVPRIIDRTVYLQWHWTPAKLILAPLYCMSLFYADTRSVLCAWASVAGAAMVLVLLQQIPHPYGGFFASGILAGLAWGLAALLLQSVAMLLARYE